MLVKELSYRKKTRLCFSADFTKKQDLFDWIHKLGNHICILKTHIDILEDFDRQTIDTLNKLKKKYNFLILEDRKFSDIGKTFVRQLYSGLYRIADWADIITIHGLCADGMLEYIKNIPSPKVLLVSQMSSKNNIIDYNYTEKCISIAHKHKNKVIGFICQEKIENSDEFIYVTPGIDIKKKTVKDQQYKTPTEAFIKGSDIIIVGSGLYKSENPIKIINEFK